jgi:squalene cyclase
MEHCFDPTMELLNDFRADNNGGWISNLRTSNASMSTYLDEVDDTDSRVVFRMAACGGVPDYDPEFQRRRIRLISKFFRTIRDKVRTHIRDTS